MGEVRTNSIRIEAKAFRDMLSNKFFECNYASLQPSNKSKIRRYFLALIYNASQGTLNDIIKQ